MPNPYDWWIEYYDRVGEHGSHRVHSREHAERDAMRLAEQAKRHPSEQWYIGIYDYGNQEGTVYWATRDYLDLLKQRAPGPGMTYDRTRMDEFMDAIVRFLEDGKPESYAYPSIPARANPSSPRWKSRLSEYYENGRENGEYIAEQILNMPRIYNVDLRALSPEELEDYIAKQLEGWWDNNFTVRPRGMTDAGFAETAAETERGFRQGFFDVLHPSRGNPRGKREQPSKGRWVLIGGYGEIGAQNWGFDPSKITAEKWATEARRHIGERVLLTGGGSSKAWMATLERVSIKIFRGERVPEVRLTDIDPPWDSPPYPNVFEPYLGSWQISIWDKNAKTNPVDEKGTTCAYCGKRKEGIGFFIGASLPKDKDWTMWEGTGKVSCPSCHEKGAKESGEAVGRHIQGHSRSESAAERTLRRIRRNPRTADGKIFNE